MGDNLTTVDLGNRRTEQSVGACTNSITALKVRPSTKIDASIANDFWEFSGTPRAENITCFEYHPLENLCSALCLCSRTCPVSLQHAFAAFNNLGILDFMQLQFSSCEYKFLGRVILKELQLQK